MRCAVLVEEHAAFRQAMAYLLERQLEVALVEEVSTVAEARAIALENLGVIDVVVSELSLRHRDIRLSVQRFNITSLGYHKRGTFSLCARLEGIQAAR